MNENPRGDYAEVNGLRMYYEVHGDGDPLVLLHGAYMTADDMRPLLLGLAENRRVIIPEMQGARAHRRRGRPPHHLRGDGRRLGRVAAASRDRGG